MKRNLIRIGLVGCVLLGLFLSGGAALAQDQPPLPAPGILPDSPWYLFDKLGKDIGMFFAFGDQAKAEKALHYAGERLAEALAMKEKNKEKLMAQAAGEYDNYMQNVQDRLRNLAPKSDSDNISVQVALATGRHLIVLDNLSDNLTGQAATAIAHAREVSVNGQEQALQALARTRAELAVRIASENINAHLEQVRNRVDIGFSGNLTGELDIADRLAAIENQLTVTAKEQGIDLGQVEAQVLTATKQRLDILERVYKEVPETAKQAVLNSSAATMQRLTTSIENLTGKSANVQSVPIYIHVPGSGNLTISGNASDPAGILNEINTAIQKLSSANMTAPGRSMGDHNP